MWVPSGAYHDKQGQRLIGQAHLYGAITGDRRSSPLAGAAYCTSQIRLSMSAEYWRAMKVRETCFVELSHNHTDVRGRHKATEMGRESKH